MATTNQSTAKNRALKIILLTGLLVGSLDILTACIDYYIATGRGPAGVLKFIASGVFGRKAFTGGIPMIILGLLFHYLIAFSFTLFFYWLHSRIKYMSTNRVLTGILYGLFIWLVMNRIVLPLSNTPTIPFKLYKAVKAATILIVMIGIPLSFIMQKYFPYHAKEYAH
ncbi:MAG TPA: hypothetical protein VGQ09_20500 [Chitinophagaceae bacterium]|jgi:hypothetical protein|nr:hypothetical protein [Chitinophagaceae bacterium]